MVDRLWSVVIPVKPFDLAKSRLNIRPVERRALAKAMALDVLDAVRLTPCVRHVVVVTADLEMAMTTRRSGGVVVVDRPMVTPDSLNRAVGMGSGWASSRYSDCAVAVVPSDLAALTSTELESVLHTAATADAGHVLDSTGMNTTILTRTVAGGMTSRYGQRSALAHAKLGMRPVSAGERARIDVDTLADLTRAAEVGLGLRAKRVVHDLGFRPGFLMGT